ncbi:hypothetical protein O2K51_05165 [Apibacter raozihei]|uniref:hypothetical protein n=1 Tax=Apibacter raozihei TaxID=2500547 RepID=UPI000FE318BE|nr:hypothetical protein [Apibacter raozihei]
MKSNIKVWLGFLIIIFSVGLYAYQSGKNSVKTKQVQSEIKVSKTKVKTYQKEYDSLQKVYAVLEKQKQKVKTFYIQGKEKIRHITIERTENYTDSLCKKDVHQLKNHITFSDSLIFLQNKQKVNTLNQLTNSENIRREQDQQIELYKKRKNTLKPFGIGIIAGYGTNFQQGLSSFLGIGISYNFIQI